MNILKLTMIGLLTISHTLAETIKTCESQKQLIQNKVLQLSTGISAAEDEILGILTPQIDEKEFQKRLKKATKEELSLTEDELIIFNKLKEKVLVSKYRWLLEKPELSTEDLSELKSLHMRLGPVPDDELEEVSSEEILQLATLKMKIQSYQKFNDSIMKSRINFSNYVRSRVQDKLLSNPYVEQLKQDETQGKFLFDGERVKISVSEFLPIRESEIQEWPPFFLKRIPDKSDARAFYDVLIDGTEISVQLTLSSVMSETQYNRDLKAVFPVDVAVFRSIGGNVRTTIDLISGKKRREYKMIISKDPKNWINYSEDYTSLEEFSKLFLPIECR